MSQVFFLVSLTREERNRMAKRYHFRKTDLSRIEVLYEEALPLVQVQVCYMFQSQTVLCAVTLGEGFDRLQERYSQAQAVSDTYILECIGSMLLEKAYEQIAAEVLRETGQFLCRMEFPGSDLPLAKMQEILQNLAKEEGILPVSCNEYFMLLPKKSVVFLGRLGKERAAGCICTNCPRKNCESRQADRKEKDAFRMPERGKERERV